VILKGLALMLSLALLGYLFKSSDLGNSVNEAWIDARVRGHGVNGALLFLLMGGLFTAIGLPRQIIAFLGGYAFSVGLGTLLGALAALLGCMLSFGYARLFGKGLLHARMGERAGRFDRFIRDHPFSMTVLVRLLPVGNNLLTNLAAGISSIRPKHFFSGTLLGYLPQTLAFALVGSGVHIAPALKLALAAGLFLLSGALGAWLYRRFRRGHSLDAQIDAALDETDPLHHDSPTKP
ncbi:MAG TPA: VTT domain-containing protein, partial [Thiobacillus sp.]|nr:VTT domain-containing protein [Thiobacillus sp.]